MSLFGKKKIKSIYFKKKKELSIKGLDASTVNFLKIVGAKNIKKSTRTSVLIDVKSVDDVEQALAMIEIVTEVK
jgi:hypothetical protein